MSGNERLGGKEEIVPSREMFPESKVYIISIIGS
jgi:hypothetical protein